MRGRVVPVDRVYANHALHKVIFPVSCPVLVAAGSHVLICKEIIISMILLPLLFLPLLRLPLLFLFLPGCAIFGQLPLLPRAHLIRWGARTGTNPLLLRCLLALAQLPLAVVPFLFKIRLLLHLSFIEAVDDGVLALGHENALDLGICEFGGLFSRGFPPALECGIYFAVVFECDLADVHGPILLKVGPGRVDDGDVVLLVAYSGGGQCE